MGARLMDQPVREIMTREPLTVTPETLASGALELMETRLAGSVTALPVVGSEGEVLGLLHIHDCLTHTR